MAKKKNKNKKTIKETLKKPKNEVEQRLLKVVKKKKGKVLEDYNGIKTKLKFQCKHDHQWQATPDSILRNTWCPACSIIDRAKKRKYSISDLKRIAKAKGGKLLSKDYLNANTSVIWECALGHQWNAPLSNIKRGSWCPVCSRLNRKYIKDDARTNYKSRREKELNLEKEKWKRNIKKDYGINFSENLFKMRHVLREIKHLSKEQLMELREYIDKKIK